MDFFFCCFANKNSSTRKQNGCKKSTFGRRSKVSFTIESFDLSLSFCFRRLDSQQYGGTRNVFQSHHDINQLLSLKSNEILWTFIAKSNEIAFGVSLFVYMACVFVWLANRRPLLASLFGRLALSARFEMLTFSFRGIRFKKKFTL